MQLEDYIEMINYLLKNKNKCHQEDMRQDLLMFLCEIFKKLENKTLEAKNLRNYIYICLKNESIRLNKVYTERRALSLNMKINEETEILDLIIEKDTRSYSIEFYKVIKVAKSILTSKEYEAVYMYFILGKTQTYISKTLNISLQCLNNRIKQAIKKIRINFEC